MDATEQPMQHQTDNNAGTLKPPPTPPELLPYVNDPRYSVETTVVVVSPTDGENCSSGASNSSANSSNSSTTANSECCSVHSADLHGRDGAAVPTAAESRLRRETLQRFKVCLVKTNKACSY